jgi:CHAT domain-containing protein
LKQLAWLLLALSIIGCESKARPDNPDPLRSTEAPLELPVDPAALATLLGSSPDSLLVAGQERYRNQAFDSAQALWNVELERTRSIKDQKAEARVLMWLGIVAWKLSDYKSARENGEASVLLKRKTGLDDELSRSFNSLGLIAYNEGRYSDALAMYDSAVAAAARHGDATGIARASANIPLVKVELGRFEEATRDFDRALQANRIAEDTRTQANLLANIGMLEIRLGNPRRAISLLDSARAMYEDNDASGKVNALGQLASAWIAAGELQRAINAADSAIQIARSEGLQQEVAANMEVLADAQLQAGNSRLALATLKSADSIDAELGLTTERGTNLRRAAMILAELGESVPAVQLSARALAEHRKASAMSEAILDRLELAKGLYFTGGIEKARPQLDSAESEARATRNPVIVNEVAITSAGLLLRVGDARGALARLDRSSKLENADDWRINNLRAASLAKLGRLPEAQQEAKHALTLVERERSSLGVGPLRSGYLSNRVTAFTRLASIQLALGDTSAAFETAASLPGRTLSERLSGLDSPGQRLTSIAQSEKLLIRAKELERQLAETRGEDGGAERARALETEIMRTRTAYESALGGAARLPRGGMLGESKITARAVQSSLAPRQALILYMSGEDRVDIFVVRRNRISHASVLISAGELARKIRFVREALQRSNDRHTTLVALANLRAILITPVERDLEAAGELIIVPHAAAGALPFAALWDAVRGRFLIEDRTITYAPTVAALMDQSRNQMLARKVAVFAPDPANLPGTKAEAVNIARLSRNVTQYIGRRSSKAAVRDALARGDLVHIASHGSHNSQNPLFSEVTVAPASRSESDAVLSVNEIMSIPVRSPLVFLSGCETALGGAGDGVFATQLDEGSLAQAFLFAGASSVVATLWPVRDREASAIAVHFYSSVSAGLSPGEALAGAQRQAIKKRGRLNWAAYTISGIGSVRKH